MVKVAATACRLKNLARGWLSDWRQQVTSLPGDNNDYEILRTAVELSKNAPGLTCEIGLRFGGSSRHIIDAIAKHSPEKTHVAVDPYGNVEYLEKEGSSVRLDYTNKMRDTCLSNLYAYAYYKGVNFIFFNLEDAEFFGRYWDGVPIYKNTKTIENRYSFVFFDGPHGVEPIQNELAFFLPRAGNGSVFVFDDLSRYDHDIVELQLFENGFEVVQKTSNKAIYIRTKVISYV